MKGLQKIESDMLEHVYNIILNIPDTVVLSIPSLRNPSVLTRLKRMRQKIKNKIQIGEKRLMNEYSKPSTSSSCKDFFNSESKSKISFINEFDSQCYDQTPNTTKFGLTLTDNSRLNTNYNQNNIVDASDTNISNFQINTPPSLNTTHNDIYTRERLSVNELDLIVNDNNFDSFFASDVQNHSVKNFNYDTHPHTETKKLPSQNNYELKGDQLIF